MCECAHPIVNAQGAPREKVAEYLTQYNKATSTSPSNVVSLNTFEKKSELFVSRLKQRLLWKGL